jgi:hypothetical protein
VNPWASERLGSASGTSPLTSAIDQPQSPGFCPPLSADGLRLARIRARAQFKPRSGALFTQLLKDDEVTIGAGIIGSRRIALSPYRDSLYFWRWNNRQLMPKEAVFALSVYHDWI